MTDDGADTEEPDQTPSAGSGMTGPGSTGTGATGTGSDPAGTGSDPAGTGSGTAGTGSAEHASSWRPTDSGPTTPSPIEPHESGTPGSARGRPADRAESDGARHRFANDEHVTTTEVRPTWKVSRLTVRLALIASFAMVTAVAIGRPELVVVAAPCLAAVVLALHRPRPTSVRVRTSVPEPRCFESDVLDVRVRVDADEPLGQIGVRPELSRAFELDDAGSRRTYVSQQLLTTLPIRPIRWGRWTVGPIRIELRTANLGYASSAVLEAGELTVFPPPSRARDLAVPPVLLDRLGNHVARRRGQGVEFAEIRAYAPGDPARRINWPVSARRNDLYVNTFAAERAADVVAILDTTVDVGPWGRSSLDLSVRGAAGVVQAYLRFADRVGVVSIGGTVRWLRPDVGTRQYYRVVETLLIARRDDSFCEPELAHLPPQALPPRALAFVFTPLLDPRAIEVVRDLRERGHPVVVVDVSSAEPSPGRTPEGQLSLRIWRLEREVLLHGLTEMGAAVVPWDDELGVPVDRMRLEPLLRGGRA